MNSVTVYTMSFMNIQKIRTLKYIPSETPKREAFTGLKLSKFEDPKTLKTQARVSFSATNSSISHVCTSAPSLSCFRSSRHLTLSSLFAILWSVFSHNSNGSSPVVIFIIFFDVFIECKNMFKCAKHEK